MILNEQTIVVVRDDSSGSLAVSPMVSAQAKESVSLKEYQQAKASQAVSLNQAMVMAFENSPVLALRRAAVSIQQGQLDHASRWAPSNPEFELGARQAPDQADESLEYGVRVTQEIWMGNRGDLGQSRARSNLTSRQQELEYLKVATKRGCGPPISGYCWLRKSWKPQPVPLNLCNAPKTWLKCP